jgi:hypothetical protein
MELGKYGVWCSFEGGTLAQAVEARSGSSRSGTRRSGSRWRCAAT